MDTAKKNGTVEETMTRSEGTEENKKHKCYLKSIYLENIKHYRNFKWTLNKNFNILSGGEFMNTDESTTRPILDLIDLVYKGKLEGFSEYVSKSNKPTALILEEVDGNDIVSHYGVFSWLGSDYIFSKKEGKLEYQKKDESVIHRVDLNTKEQEWQGNTDRMILCLLIYTSSGSETTDVHFSSKPKRKCVIEDQCHGELVDGEVTLFFHNIKVEEGEVRCKGEPYKSYQSIVEYCCSLEKEIKSTSGPVVTGAWNEKLINKSFLDKLENIAKERGVQVLLVTDKICFKPNYLKEHDSKSKGHQVFFTKCLYDQNSNTVGIIPLYRKGEATFALKDENAVCEAELIVHVEGIEDKYILEGVMKVLAEKLEEPSEILDMKKYSDQERQALSLMLKNTRVNCLNGKGNVKNVEKYLRLPIPSVVVLDTDALFVKCSAEIIQDIPNNANILPISDGNNILSPLDEDNMCVASPVYLMNAIYKKPDMFHGSYKSRDDLPDCAQPHLKFSNALKKCMKDDLKLTMAAYKQILQGYGHIFSWEGGNGTSSGAFCLDKGQVVKGRQIDIAKEIKKKLKGITENDNNIVWKNLTSFKDFLLEHTFKYYTNFYEELFMELDPEVSSERLTYREDINEPDAGHLSISYVPTIPLDDAQVKDILQESLHETAKTLEGRDLNPILTESEENKIVVNEDGEEGTAHPESGPKTYPFHDIRCTEKNCLHNHTALD